MYLLRRAAAFVLVLGALSAAGFALQQRLYHREPVLDLTPARSAPPVAAGPVVAAAAPTSQVPVVDDRWVRRTATAAGIPRAALRSYGRASLMTPADCRLGWTTLAGIGWVESQHGTLGGRTLDGAGYSSTRILGPALDGRGDVAAIPATADGTTWHGDPDWDHAIGQMQFIPSTWDSWGSDGDGDGRADPNDIDDAAYAAARYLCADGRDLSTGTGWSGGILSYNHAQEYVDAVHVAATAYAERTS